jgi:hypothetical protein
MAAGFFGTVSPTLRLCFCLANPSLVSTGSELSLLREHSIV